MIKNQVHICLVKRYLGNSDLTYDLTPPYSTNGKAMQAGCLANAGKIWCQRRQDWVPMQAKFGAYAGKIGCL